MNMIMPGKVMANIDIIPKYLKIESCSRHCITRNSSHIASRIPHVNQMEQKKWLPDVIKKCMGSKIKYQFSAVQIN